MCQVLQSAAVEFRQQAVLAAIVPTDLGCTGQYLRRHGPYPVRVTRVRAIPNLQRNERSRRTIAWIFLSCTEYNFCTECNGHFLSLIIFERYSYFKKEVCTRMIRRIRIPGTYHTTAAAVPVPVVILQSVTASCGCLLL